MRGSVPLVTVGAGAGACVVLAVAFASGRISGGGLTALAAAAFLLVVGWCFTNRRVDRTLAVVALYLGLLDGYAKLKTGGSSVTLARDGLIYAVAAGAVLRTAPGQQRLSPPPLLGFVIAFVAVVLIELANPSSRGLTASLAGARQHLEFVPLFFLGYAFVRTEAQVRKALLILVICAAAGGVVSYIQSRLTPAQLAGWGAGYAERINGTGIFRGASRVGFIGTSGAPVTVVRPFGLGSEIGSGALAAGLAFPALIALLMVSRGWLRATLALMSLGIGLGVATSGSRAALIVVFVSLAAFALIAAASKNALRAVVGLIIGGAVIFTAFSQLGASNASAQRAQSITPSHFSSTFATERSGSVLLFGPLASQHPLGVGLGTVGPASTFGQSVPGATYNSETEWNFLVVELGVAGVIIYVAFSLRVMWLSMRRIRHVVDPGMRLCLAALAAPIFALLIAGFGGPISASAPASPYLWLVSGVLSYWLVSAYRGEGVGASAFHQRSDRARIADPPTRHVGTYPSRGPAE